MKIEVSVVVPCYRCPQVLEELCQRLIDSLRETSDSFEIIFVNDACPENSWGEISRLSNLHSEVVGVDLSRNFGQHRAITAGLAHSRGSWVVVMDCDLQDRPEEIPKMLELVKGQKIDYVTARRVNRQDKMGKKLTSRIFYNILSFFTDHQYDSTIGNFGVYGKNVIDSVLSMREQLKFFPIMVRWTGYYGQTMDVEHNKRAEGSSSYSWKKLIDLGTDIIIAYSDKPLRLAIKIGFFISALAFLYTIYLLIKYVVVDGEGIPLGWSTLIVTISFFSGMIIFFLGILGVYIGRIYEESKSRPSYIIREVIN